MSTSIALAGVVVVLFMAVDSTTLDQNLAGQDRSDRDLLAAPTVMKADTIELASSKAVR